MRQSRIEIISRRFRRSQMQRISIEFPSIFDQKPIAHSMRYLFFVAVIGLIGCSSTEKYPEHWFATVNDPNAPSWEILPQAAGPGEVVLSKRNELGLLSNFAETPFTMDGKRYASVEGFWQSLKYPESSADPRAQVNGIKWTLSRTEVEQLSSFEAKRAGKTGSKVMKKLGINWVTYQGQRMTYRTATKGPHFMLIERAMRSKVEQNPKVKKVLMKTGGLALTPDHTVKPPIPPAWRYYDILMKIRGEMQTKNAL